MKNFIMIVVLTIASMSVMACKEKSEVGALSVPQDQLIVSSEAGVAATAVESQPAVSNEVDSLQLAANDSIESADETDENDSDDEAYQAADQACQEQAQQSTSDSEGVYNSCMEALGFSSGSGDDAVVQ